MAGFSWIRLFSACYKFDGFRGLMCCFKYLFGLLKLDEKDLKSCIIQGGVSDG